MRLDELPETPKIWADFLLSKLSFPPGPAQMPRLRALADSLQKRRAQGGGLVPASGSVVVMANFYASLFGGPVSQILKCLTAVKVCQQLAEEGIAASPVIWIHANPPAGFAPGILNLLDRDWELQRLEVPAAEIKSLNSMNPRQSGRMADLLSEVETIGAGAFDAEILALLKDSFCCEETLSAANAHLIESLMKEWGVTVVEPKSAAAERAISADPPAPHVPVCIAQSLAMPVIAFISGPEEIALYAQAMPAFTASGIPQPAIWPQCSATLITTRVRRTLERYSLTVADLFGGEERALAHAANSGDNEVAETLRRLQSEVQECMAELGVLEAQDPDFGKIRKARQEKILFQLAKMQTQCVAAIRVREQTARRRIHRACNLLAPNGRLQESELGGIQIPLRYARAGLRTVYEKLDIRKPEHLFIEMD